MRAPRRRHGRMSPEGATRVSPAPTAAASASPSSRPPPPPKPLSTVASAVNMPASPPTTSSSSDNEPRGRVTGVRGGPRVTSNPLEEQAAAPPSSSSSSFSSEPLGAVVNGGSPTLPLITGRVGSKRPRGPDMCRRGSRDAGESVRAVVACAPVKTTPPPFAFAAHGFAPNNDELAGSLRARVQRLLVQFVMLPVVWVSLCCVITAAMGIEAVESIQKALEHDPHACDSDDCRPAKKPKRDLEVDRLAPRRRETRSPPVEPDASAVVYKHKSVRGENTVQATPVSPPPHRRRRRVLIWDLDETLVLFASLYSGQFARNHGADLATSVALGEQMMTYLLAVLERHFFFSDLHDADIDHISCVASHGHDSAGTPRARVLADRYARIRAIYERHDARGPVDFLDDPTSQWFTARQALVTSIDMLSTGWIREARELLALTSAGLDTGDEIINVMVTNTQLSPALCKCLIYGLDAHFPIENVYSSSRLHKLRCFETIRAKYSDVADVEFIGIGDGAEEEQVSRALGMAFFKIRAIDDLRGLRHELQLAEHTPHAPQDLPPSPPTRVPSPPTGFAATTTANE